MNKIKSIASQVYNFTHIFVGAGAVVLSFLDTQALSAKDAAAVVLLSQGLKVFSNYVDEAHAEAPVALKAVQGVVAQAQSVAALAHAPAPVVADDAAPAQSIQHIS